MKKALSAIRKPAFSLLEVVLAISLFSIFALTTVSVLLYSEESLLSVGQSSRAALIAEESLEATRSIRNEDFTLLTDGDHGLSSSSGKWQFTGASDVTDGFTRQVNISSPDSDTKKITARVSWPKRTGQVVSIDLTSDITNWSAYSGIPGFGNWTNPYMESYATLTGGKDGVKVQVQGNYVYVVRDSAADSFVSIDVTDTKKPRVASQKNLKDNPKNLSVAGSLALIATRSNSAELQSADIADPNSPVMKGEFDAESGADAYGIASVGNLAYLTRIKGDGAEFYVIDMSNLDQPVQVGTLELNSPAYEIVILDHFAYLASGPDKQLKVVDIADPAQPQLIGSYNLPQSQNALTITGFDKTVLLGTDKGMAYVFDVSTPTSPKLKGTLTLKDNNNNIIHDVALGLDNHYLFIASNVAARELQVFDFSNPAVPLFISSFDAPGALYGVAYDNAQDRAFVTGIANNQSMMIIAPQ